jgi:hypothetical protein
VSPPGEGSVYLPLPVHIPLVFPIPGHDPVEIGQAGLHLSDDGRHLLFSAILRGLGRVEGEIPIPVVDR